MSFKYILPYKKKNKEIIRLRIAVVIFIIFFV